MLFFSKNKRLVREAESVGKHHHHHRYLETSLIDTYLLSCLDERPRIYVGKYDFVYRLIHYAGNTEHKQRQGITKHLAEQSNAETPFNHENIGYLQKQHYERRQEVGNNNIFDILCRIVEPIDKRRAYLLQLGAEDKEKQIESDIGKHDYEL